MWRWRFVGERIRWNATKTFYFFVIWIVYLEHQQYGFTKMVSVFKMQNIPLFLHAFTLRRQRQQRSIERLWIQRLQALEAALCVTPMRDSCAWLLLITSLTLPLKSWLVAETLHGTGRILIVVSFFFGGEGVVGQCFGAWKLNLTFKLNTGHVSRRHLLECSSQLRFPFCNFFSEVFSVQEFV